MSYWFFVKKGEVCSDVCPLRRCRERVTASGCVSELGMRSHYDPSHKYDARLCHCLCQLVYLSQDRSTLLLLLLLLS